MSIKFEHKSILLDECIENLNIKKNGTYIDGTMGGAGHSFQICKNLNETGKFIGIDQDISAITISKERLSSFKNTNFVHDNFSNIENIAKDLNLYEKGIDGFLLDLGVSSHQLDEGNRGFSYMQDANLDMRMDIRKDLSAYDIVNKYSEDELFRIIKNYGEEKWAKRIAKFIINERSQNHIETTFQLVSVIKKAIPKGARIDGPHPAKRTFQAIRIEVNSELEILNNTIDIVVSLLNKGGRLCIITFHSLEDRIVKQKFKTLENPCICPRDLPVCGCGRVSTVKIITRKPIVPLIDELDENHRARSAKLRVLEKI